MSEGFKKIGEMLIQGLADTYAHVYDSNGVMTPTLRHSSISSASTSSSKELSSQNEGEDNPGKCGC